MMRERVLRELKGDISLPALPEVLLRLDRELADPEADARRIADIVAVDAVLAGQVLRMANSAYYARGGTTLTNVMSAVTRLGQRTLRGLVYALTLPQLFRTRSVFPHQALWRHSLAVAAFADCLARRVGVTVEQREVVYFAGLTHDIGALVLAQILPAEYEAFLVGLKRANQESEGNSKPEDSDLASRERAAFGIDHAEVGAIFLQDRWQMKTEIVDCVRCHHEVGWNEETDSEIVETLLVHVANGVCNRVGAGWDPVSGQILPFREGVWERLGIPLSAVEELIEETRDSLGQAELLLSMA